MSTNHFVRPVSGYTRNLEVLDTANELAAQYLHLHTGMPIYDCLEFVEQEIASRGHRTKNSLSLQTLKRQPNQDRAKSTDSFDATLAYIKDTRSILAPNFVIYDNPSVNKSITAKYAENKMAKRKVVKRRGLDAKQNNEMSVYTYCNNQEYDIKVLINSISGGHASPHNPLWNKTAHSSLTSITRTIVSYSNASTEKLIMGNRHYYNTDIVIENILSIVKNSDYFALATVIAKYKIALPSEADVITAIERCTMFYRFSKVTDIRVRNLVTKLTPIQRAAFLYSGDMYNLDYHNPMLIKCLLFKIVGMPTDYLLTEIEAETIIKSSHPAIVTLACIFCREALKGGSVEKLRATNIAGYIDYARTVQHIADTLAEYSDLIGAFLVTDNVPSSIYEFPNSIRRCVVGSDTDSTMFTVQYWIQRWFGKLCFSKTAIDVSNTLCYINTQVIAHMLAWASKQMGVPDEYLFQLEMKNEYSFPIYMRANRAKHYATLLAAREGNVFLIPENDIKGVGLKDSKVPRLIMQALDREINYVMLELLAEHGVDIHPLMQRIANLEHTILASIRAGKLEYLSTVSISAKDAYKNPMASKYIHYDLWVNVFQQRYGEITPPPYRNVKLSTTLNKSHTLLEWVNSLDSVTASLFKQWLRDNKSKIPHLSDEPDAMKGITLEQVLLPTEIFGGGIPPEFINIINTRKIVSELMGGFYILLEMCGMYIKNKNATILLHDNLMYRPEYGLPGSLLSQPQHE